MKKRFLKYGITGGVCLGLAALYCALRDYSALPLPEKYRALCDGFTLSGLLALCAGSLLWVAGDGFFNGLGYCLHIAWNGLLPGGRRRPERYGDYVGRCNQRKVSGFSFLLVWGGVCMAAAIVFLVLFYRTR